MSMEGLVRPFQTGQSAVPNIVPNSGIVKVQPLVKLRIGRGTSVRSQTASTFDSVNFYTIKYPRAMTLAEILAQPLPQTPHGP